jgi:hypothetical protein
LSALEDVGGRLGGEGAVEPLVELMLLSRTAVRNARASWSSSMFIAPMKTAKIAR